MGLLAGWLAAGAWAQQPVVLPAPTQILGPYPVGCSNVAQDLSLATAAPDTYWEGSNDDRSRYINLILAEPWAVVSYLARSPDSSTLFDRTHGGNVDYVAIVCYPTTVANARPDYALADGRIVPRMQRGIDAPILPPCPAGVEVCTADVKRWPLMLYSHGLGGSPISDSYLETILAFASYGYIVAAPFHADPRFSRTRLEDIQDISYIFREFEELVEMQAVRPIAMQALLDHLLVHPDFAQHIDADRVAGFGASMGGLTMMLLAGAELTIDPLDRSRRQVTTEPRLKAITTFVPYSGVGVLPAMGDDNRGARKVSTPYLGVAGREDDIAPLGRTREAVQEMSGTRHLIAIEGMGHGSDELAFFDAFGWYLPFLEAELNGDRTALSQIYRATHVAGFRNDERVETTQKGLMFKAGEPWAVEFYHSGLDHYFITADPAEATLLLENPAWGWALTGSGFVVANATDPAAQSVHRFYGSIDPGPNSHFYTASTAERDQLVAIAASTPVGPRWNLEGVAFHARIPDASGACPDDAPFRVARVYNGGTTALVDGRRLDPNHRYGAVRDVLLSGSSATWQEEGTAFCSAAPIGFALP